ncbi:unnamed protein product [Mycena citricolor]|uniref:Uncharacterized protein n=1 Tax=Mycena citricolor TaxID=2018698 RepID=A0AAD2K0T2_9AGAR|nr:unnamed protein product [Mycena citricolor]
MSVTHQIRQLTMPPGLKGAAGRDRQEHGIVPRVSCEYTLFGFPLLCPSLRPKTTHCRPVFDLSSLRLYEYSMTCERAKEDEIKGDVKLLSSFAGGRWDAGLKTSGWPPVETDHSIGLDVISAEHTR